MRLVATIITLSILLYSCKPSADDLLQKELKKHIQLQKENVNIISVGNTISFEQGIREGIDRSRYPAPDLHIELDTTFFKYQESKTFSNPDEAGGISTRLDIYKATQSGKTQIKAYEIRYTTKENNERIFDTTTNLIGMYTIVIR